MLSSFRSNVLKKACCFGGRPSAVITGVPYKDPEMDKQAQRARYLRNREARIEYARQQRRENGTVINERRRERYQDRKDETAAARLIYQQAWHDAHPGYARESGQRRRAAHPEDLEYFSRWRRENPEAVRAYTAQRRKTAAFGMTEQDKRESIEWRKIIAGDPCFYCGTAAALVYEDDH